MRRIMICTPALVPMRFAPAACMARQIVQRAYAARKLLHPWPDRRRGASCWTSATVAPLVEIPWTFSRNRRQRPC